jgi:hypothetical protein
LRLHHWLIGVLRATGVTPSVRIYLVMMIVPLEAATLPLVKFLLCACGDDLAIPPNGYAIC